MLSPAAIANRRAYFRAYARNPANKPKILARNRAYRLKNREKALEYQRQWQRANRDKSKEYRERYNEKYPDRIPASQKKYHQANREKRCADSKQWKLKNPTRYKEWRRLYQRRRYETDAGYRLICNLRTRVRLAIKNGSKALSTLRLVGCSIEDLRIYLETKFETGMTWENYGKVWEVDHIMPCAIFDLTKSDHQRRCFHFSNLQPLFTKENQSKGSKVLDNQFALL